MLIIEDFPIFCNGDAEKMQCSSVNQAHSPGNCTFPHSTCNHASRSAAFFPVFMLLLFKFVISNSPKIGNLALTFPIACGKLINADEAACLISLDADIAQLVERLIRNHQVKGSSPFIGSIFYRGVAQFGSAFGSGPKGRRFKSCHLDHCPVLQNEEPGFLLSTICPKYAVFCGYFCVFASSVLPNIQN